MSPPFATKYGPYALIAGASEGLGGEFALQIAARGLPSVLVARRQAPLSAIAERILRQHGLTCPTLACDLRSPDLLEQLAPVTDGLEIGLVVYNAATSVIGEFLDRDLDDHLRTIDVNCRGPVLLAHRYGRPMAARGRGGIILMSSMAGTQGSAMVATYAATKAFNLVLGEALWDELRSRGVDALACRAGATRTPAYESSRPQNETSPVMEAAPVVKAALDGLGRTPSLVPGAFNQAATFFMSRLLPRRVAVQIIGNTTRKMYAK